MLLFTYMNNERKVLKFFLGYFLLIWPLLFPSVRFFQFIISTLTGFKNVSEASMKNFYPSPATLSTVIYLSIIFFIYYLVYKRWGNLKLLIGVIVAVFITDFIFGIVIVFTFPIWIGVGFVLLIYSLLTGLFKKNQTLMNNYSTSYSPDQQANVPEVVALSNNSNSKKKFISIGLLFFGIFSVFYLVYFGGITPCVYTTEKINDPNLPVGSKMIVRGSVESEKKTASLVPKKNIDKSQFAVFSCPFTERPDFDFAIDQDGYFGVSTGFLSEGTTLDVVANYIVTKHGLTTIDSGSGGLQYVLLKDDKGVKYASWIKPKYGYEYDIVIPMDRYLKLNLVQVEDARIFSPGPNSIFKDGNMGKFIFPAGGESIKSGSKNKIVWQMPKSGPYLSKGMGISLVDADNDLSPVKEITEILSTATSTDWDFKTDLNSSVIKPGRYKLKFWYEYPGGNAGGVFESNSFDIVK